jgi:hypothetical protein
VSSINRLRPGQQEDTLDTEKMRKVFERWANGLPTNSINTAGHAEEKLSSAIEPNLFGKKGTNDFKQDGMRFDTFSNQTVRNNTESS